MSFRARLTLAYLVLLTLALSAFGLGVYAYVDRRLHQEFYASVQRQSGQLAQILDDDYEQASTVTSATLDRWSDDKEPDTFIVVEERTDPDTELSVVAKHPADLMAAKDLPEVPAGEVVSVRADANDLRLPLAIHAATFEASTPVRRDPASLNASPDAPKQFIKVEGRVTVARSLAGVERSLGLLRTILIGGGLAVLLVAASLGLGLAAGLLRPLARMRATAQRIGDERDFSQRMPVDGNRHDELGRLSQSFNQMLAELEQSNLDLKSTLESQRRFVADASHELRTPLTAIRTNVEFLSRVPGARPQDRSEALDDVLAELRRMEALVGDLLALARLEAASQPAKRAFRLDHLLVEVHREALRVAPPGLEVALGPVPEVWVSGDRDDLRRAVWNLVDNALKYTRTGRVDLRLHATDGVAELAVHDTGIGIAEAHVGHVFDRFWRAPGVRGTAGSGLGLAITRWVAQAHDGTVAVSSAAGKGSTFMLTLPVVRGPARGRARQRVGQLIGANPAGRAPKAHS
jgi:signal transduction histidine kinase